MKVDVYDSRDNCINTIENVVLVVSCKDNRHLITHETVCKCCGHNARFIVQCPASHVIEIKP